MAFVLNDRVKETTTTAGTGTVNLAGAETGFESFVAGIGNSNTTYYAIVHQSLDEFEVGLGTITDASPDTLARTTVISSSNSDSAVNFSAGTKDVFCTLPASKAVVEDGSDNIALGAAPTVSNASGDLTLDVVGNLNLDADGGSFTFKDDGLLTATFARSVANFEVTVNQSDGDFVLKGNDGGSALTAITVDMSNGGEAIFYGGIDIAANTDIELNYGTWTGEKAAKIQAHGNNMYHQFTSNFICRNASGTNVFNCDSSGNGTFSANVTAYSDFRIKEDIKTIDNALDKVCKLRGVEYTRKETKAREIGVIAQEVKEIVPELVNIENTKSDINSEGLEDLHTMKYQNTVGLLIEAIKELEKKVKDLEDK